MCHNGRKGVAPVEKVRCKMCGRPPEDDPEFAIKAFQHREAEKQGRARGPLVYICPICQGRARYESDPNRKPKF
jgi:hypothetical protein